MMTFLGATGAVILLVMFARYCDHRLGRGGDPPAAAAPRGDGLTQRINGLMAQVREPDLPDDASGNNANCELQQILLQQAGEIELHVLQRLLQLPDKIRGNWGGQPCVRVDLVKVRQLAADELARRGARA